MKNSDIVIKDGYLDTSIFKSSNESSNGIVRNLLELFYALFLLLKILFILLADFSLAEVSKCAYIFAVVL